jgi:uncharacterized repeat protein (TIGR01451 family)
MPIVKQEKNMNGLYSKMLRNVFLMVVLAVLIAVCGPKGALADVTVPDPSLPPLTGHWTHSPADAYARYAGNLVAYGKALEGEIHLRHISLREFHNIRRSTDGTDEIIEFDGAVEGNVFYMRFVMGLHTSEDNSSMTFYDMAHMRIRVKEKAGHTTGTFQLELESLLITLPARDAAGNETDIVYVRNLQGQSSGGSITISEQGGGSYLMSGYLNAYTEGAMPTLSASEYFPDTNGPVYLELQSFTSGSCDLSVSQTASTPVYQGGNLTYTITVTNSSSTWAEEVILAETLPAGATLVAATLESVGMFGSTEEECALTGGDLVCTLNNISNFSGPAVVKVTVTLPAAASVTNSVRVTSMNPDPDLNNNKSELTTAVSTTSSSADLSVTQTASPDPGIKNSNLTYTVTVSNKGPSASGVVLTDVLPDSYFADYVPGSMVSSQGICSIIGGEDTANCDLGTINPGGTASFSIAVKPKEPFKLTNSVAVSSSVPDPERASNSSTLETKVSPTDLTISQTANPSPATVGGNLTYTITVNNNGPEAVEDMNIADTIPATVNIVSLTPADSCDWGPEKIYCIFPNMAAGASEAVTLVVTPTLVGSLTNEVELVSSTPNVNTANNFSSISTEVVTASKVKVVVEGQPALLRDTLASAYAAAPTGATIQARALTFPEEPLTLGEEKVITLKGGYDAAFSGNDGTSVLDGTLTIGRGAMTVERFIIQ